jgi:hypothetical protein
MDLFRGLLLPGVVYNLKYLLLNETTLEIGFAQFDFIPASSTAQ